MLYMFSVNVIFIIHLLSPWRRNLDRINEIKLIHVGVVLSMKIIYKLSKSADKLVSLQFNLNPINIFLSFLPMRQLMSMDK